MKTLIFLFIVCCFLFFNAAQAANSLDVAINEVAWMGTPISPNDEWIELYNNTLTPIDISSWTLKAQDGSPTIILKGAIPAFGFFLLERTDDETMPNVPADQIYTGALENTGEKLELRNNNNFLVDIIDCSSGWFAGDNSTKQTMERKSPKSEGNIANNWQSSLNAGGTPKSANSAQPPTPSPTPTPLPSATNTPPIAETSDDAIAPTNIFTDSLKISEFIPNPKGNDEENEWIELYSDSDQKADISNWKLKSGEKTFVIPSQTFISPNEFMVLGVKTTGLTLKNSDSSLEFYYPNGALAQKIDYKETKEGWSISKIDREYLWTENPTPGLPNQKSPDQKPQPTSPKEFKELNSQNNSEPISLGTEPSPTPEKLPAPLDSKHLTGLKENPENKNQENLLNSSWFGFALIIIFGFLAGLGLVKIRK